MFIRNFGEKYIAYSASLNGHEKVGGGDVCVCVREREKCNIHPNLY
jgi:hypothetical protein